MVQSTNIARTYSPNGQRWSDIAAKANTIIYEGAALQRAAGSSQEVAELVVAATDAFIGFAEREVDNRTSTNPGHGLENSKRVRYRSKGTVEIDVVGADATTDPGTKVYASDSETFTLTSTSNTLIGRWGKHISGTKGKVHFTGLEHRDVV